MGEGRGHQGTSCRLPGFSPIAVSSSSRACSPQPMQRSSGVLETQSGTSGHVLQVLMAWSAERVVVSFRGTASWQNVLADLQFWLTGAQLFIASCAYVLVTQPAELPPWCIIPLCMPSLQLHSSVCCLHASALVRAAGCWRMRRAPAHQGPGQLALRDAAARARRLPAQLAGQRAESEAAKAHQRHRGRRHGQGQAAATDCVRHRWCHRQTAPQPTDSALHCDSLCL